MRTRFMSAAVIVAITGATAAEADLLRPEEVDRIEGRFVAENALAGETQGSFFVGVVPSNEWYRTIHTAASPTGIDVYSTAGFGLWAEDGRLNLYAQTAAGSSLFPLLDPPVENEGSGTFDATIDFVTSGERTLEFDMMLQSFVTPGGTATAGWEVIGADGVLASGSVSGREVSDERVSVLLPEAGSYTLSLRSESFVSNASTNEVFEVSASSAWNLSVLLIPSPGAAGVCGLAGLVAIRRRR